MLYDELSRERKELQNKGLLPEFYTTGGYQLLKANYLWAETPLIQYKVIANTAARYLKGEIGIRDLPKPDNYNSWEEAFFDIIWKGWLSPSTPVLSNMGNALRGMPVSCSGQYCDDSVDSFYTNLHESAMLSKHGFGTSIYVGDVRPRGTPMMGNTGKASGIMPVIDLFAQMATDISQGSNRRGSIACYLGIDHPDFYEVLNNLEENQKKYNIGWNVPNSFIRILNSTTESDNLDRFQSSLKVKLKTGKGYYSFIDKINDHKPVWVKQNGHEIKAQNLCAEITLPANNELSYTCVLSSMNLAKYDEWKDTNAIYIATVFLDCVASEFIKQAKEKNILPKEVKFTEEYRALGLGLMGFASLLSKKMIPFEDLRASYLNQEVIKLLQKESTRATEDMGKYLGESLVCKGFGRRNSHCIAIAPTKSTALILGGVSESISPHIGMTYVQSTPAGDIDRVNPELVNLMKSKNIFSKKHLQEVIESKGSIQNVSWLTDEEKLVFRTAYEINQEVVIRYASIRQKYIDQGQSINLYFDENADEGEIARVHQLAFEDPEILSLYYVYSKKETVIAKEEISQWHLDSDTIKAIERGECQACEG